MTAERSPSRLAGLDILRGLAALMVVIFHYTVIFPEFYTGGTVVPLNFTLGVYGVHLFFIVSGFVILMSLERSAGSGFIKSRFTRLYPVYWASIAVTLMFMALLAPFPYEATWKMIAINPTMFQSFLRVENIDSVYWSLAYELGFYIFMFTFFQLNLRRFLHFLPLAMTAGTVLFLGIKAYIPAPLNLVTMINGYAYLFAAGLAFYLIKTRGWSWLYAPSLIGVPCIMLYYDGPVGGLVGAALLLAGAWGGLAGPASTQAAGKHLSAILIWLGGISYALYLTHQMIGFAIMGQLQMRGASAALSTLAALACALIIAHLLTAYVEKPAARWLKTRL